MAGSTVVTFHEILGFILLFKGCRASLKVSEGFMEAAAVAVTALEMERGCPSVVVPTYQT